MYNIKKYEKYIQIEFILIKISKTVDYNLYLKTFDSLFEFGFGYVGGIFILISSELEFRDLYQFKGQILYFGLNVMILEFSGRS